MTDLRTGLAASLVLVLAAAPAAAQQASTPPAGAAPAMGGQGTTSGYESDVLFRGTFDTLNRRLVGADIEGGLAITKAGFDVVAVLIGDNVPTGRHPTRIHGFPGEGGKAARCPTADADTNGDGIIDHAELVTVAGEALIPLDYGPTGQSSLPGIPVAGPEGKVRFREAIDIDAVDARIRESHGGSLRLENTVVVMQGAPLRGRLPASVETPGDLPVGEALPIACAELAAVRSGGGAS